MPDGYWSVGQRACRRRLWDGDAALAVVLHCRSPLLSVHSQLSRPPHAYYTFHLHAVYSRLRVTVIFGAEWRLVYTCIMGLIITAMDSAAMGIAATGYRTCFSRGIQLI